MQSIIFFPRQQLSFLFTNYMVKGVFLGFKYRQDKQFQDFPGGAVLRICLPMQGTQVRALVQEDPTCHGATKPVRHNY